MEKREGTEAELRQLLERIDHRGYPAYRELTGRYQFGEYVLSIDHVQGDPFAAPSAVSIHVSQEKAGFPEQFWKGREKKAARIALQDHLLRRFDQEIQRYSHRAGGSGKSGLMVCSHPGQEILERTACEIHPESGNLILRFSVGFPAAGRTVLAGELEKILFRFLPVCVRNALLWKNLPAQEVEDAVYLAEDQAALREELPKKGLVAFLADGAILPRESGISQKPMKGAVPFTSPAEDRVAITLPHAGTITGMGIPSGITLIIGGGYHGKSTLLQALERGVYDHIRGDGREYVAADATAVKIRAEDGRSVLGDDISFFIRNLPSGKDTHFFSTEDASGSTSEAASLVEAVESGSKILLMDEDTCAANFMVRDDLMQQIVSADEEPIIPYSDRMRALWQGAGISTILVAGSSGAFFQKADRIIQMKQYLPEDVTENVRRVTGPVTEEKTDESVFPVPDFSIRTPVFTLREERGRIKHKNLGKDGFSIGRHTVDLRCVEQIVDGEQTETLSCLLLYLAESDMNGHTSLQSMVRHLARKLDQAGIDAAVKGRIPGNLAMPRAQEILAALNRCRLLRIQGD